MAAPSPVATLKNGTGFSFGFAQKELGVNADSLDAAFEPEFIIVLPNEQNCGIVKSYGPLKVSVTLSGEINNTTGIMALVLAQAFAFANQLNYFGATALNLLFEGASVAFARGAFLKLNQAKFEHLAGIPAS